MELRHATAPWNPNSFESNIIEQVSALSFFHYAPIWWHHNVQWRLLFKLDDPLDGKDLSMQVLVHRLQNSLSEKLNWFKWFLEMQNSEIQGMSDASERKDPLK